MKKKMLLSAIVLVSFFVLSQITDPLEALLNFMIAGIIPGTDISLSLLPSIAFIASLLLLMRSLLSNLRFQMLRRSALLTNAEKVQNELSSDHMTEKELRKNSAGAKLMPKTEQTLST